MNNEFIISGIILVAIASALILIPLFGSQDIYFLNSSPAVNNTNAETTVCANVGTGKLIVKDSTNGNCNIKSLVGSADISVTNTTNTIVIDYNGTIVSDDTTCLNVGTGSQVYKDGECNFRTVLGSPDISVTQQTNTITIDFNGTIINESTSCNNLGAGKILCTGGNVNIRTLVAGTGISLSNDTNTITITNTGVISNSCTSPITCSGTNPSTIACSTCLVTANGDKFIQLGQFTSLASSAILIQDSGTNANTVFSSTTVKSIAEKVTGTSALVGKTVNAISIGMFKTNSPTGTGTLAVLDSSNNIKYTFCTFNIASITTSFVRYNCTNTVSTYTIVSGDYVGVTSPLQTGTNTASTSASTTNVYDSTNSVLSTFTSVWADTSTVDVGSTTMGFHLDYMPYVTFTATKHLIITAEMRITGAVFDLALVFNGAESPFATNYAHRFSLNGGADTTGVSQKVCLPQGTNQLANSDSPFLYAYIDNNDNTDNKLLTGSLVGGAESVSSTAPTKTEFTCKWVTSSQISSIAITSGRTTATTAQAFFTGTTLTVWGYN